VWFVDDRYLLWSDPTLDRITRWDEETGQVSIFRKLANKPNGLTRDRQGQLLTCEHAGRRVTRTEYDGTITVLIDRFEGKRLNSPNDIVVKSDDSIWFTDPVYGITSSYSGIIDRQELPTNVYRLDKTGRATVLAGDVNRPDGLAFSPDETKLYIIEDGATPQAFRVYDVVDDGTKLANARTFITVEREGIADGLRVDVDGNLWCGWGGGAGNDRVMIFTPADKLIGRIDLPERCANVCFAGKDRGLGEREAGPTVESCTAANRILLDHLLGAGEQSWWHLDAERRWRRYTASRWNPVGGPLRCSMGAERSSQQFIATLEEHRT
jgi:gluconolactonase